MDKKDLKLLEILQRQGRMAVSELADKVNMSDTPCLRRVKKLEQDKVILGYGAQVDPFKVGLNVVVYTSIRLTEHTDQSTALFESTMAQLPQVMECAVVTGSYDYMLKIVAKNLVSYEQFIKKSLGNLKFVASIETTVVLKQIFSRTALPVDQSPIE
ncbi:Lrp/AsnC family transcriptional regulator [uncultured Shewanella sp.]|jgi:DNA-binding Lrp family transcriptional regulator|uniref:Lrp/AsnC family transcriptional regulator n=1 Tax=uncultured Shewanella sp. TaxID=173975 RepID=UPI003704AD66